MNRIWFTLSMIVYIALANIINYAVIKTYSDYSAQYFISGIAGALILLLIFYFRVKDGKIEKIDKIGGYALCILSVLMPFTIYGVLIIGLIHRSKSAEI